VKSVEWFLTGKQLTDGVDSEWMSLPGTWTKSAFFTFLRSTRHVILIFLLLCTAARISVGFLIVEHVGENLQVGVRRFRRRSHKLVERPGWRKQKVQANSVVEGIFKLHAVHSSSFPNIALGPFPLRSF
jgi:hypothetical protein